MKFASEFVVPAAPDKVFALFFDPETMRACIPGCEELRQIDEKTYRGSLVNEIAHVKFRAGFSAEIQSVTQADGPDRPGVVKALLKGEDRRLGSTIKIDATMTVTPRNDQALVSYELEMAMWGKLGRLGESVIRRRSSEVEQQFAAALAAVCAGQPVPEPTRKRSRSHTTPTASPTAAGTAAGTASNAVTGAAGTAASLGVPAATAPAAAPVAAATAVPGRDPRDLQLTVAVALAAFAFGVLLGGRKGARR